MSDAFTYSWQSVERGVWEYWNKVFGTVEGLTAYNIRSLPKTLPDANSFIWKFKMGGGQITVRRQTREKAVNGAWLMDAMLEAWTIDDDTALWIGGIIMEHNPIVSTDGIGGLQRCDATAFPDRENDTIRLGGTDNAGQEILCVRVFVPMQVAFGNTERTV